MLTRLVGEQLSRMHRCQWLRADAAAVSLILRRQLIAASSPPENASSHSKSRLPFPIAIWNDRRIFTIRKSDDKIQLKLPRALSRLLHIERSECPIRDDIIKTINVSN